MRKELSFKVPKISFWDNLVSIIINLDFLRRKEIFYGTTNPHIFFQLKDIFHTLESLWSARIEWNHTTLSDYIEQKLENPNSTEQSFLEIKNSEIAIDFIEKHIETTPINRAFISEIHKIVTDWLIKEWSIKPWEYRKVNVTISGSNHIPPDFSQVPVLMEKLVDFINDKTESKYDLIKIAMFHHYFTWIHPFDNGNGRTVRLLTYALLIKCWFNVNKGRILNPTAIFDEDRKKYYNKLQKADLLTDAGMIEWCEYILGGFEREINKIDKLLDHNYLAQNILIPSLNFALEREFITKKEFKILIVAVNKQEIQLSDVKHLFPWVLDSSLSRTLKQLRDKNMLMPIQENKRTYQLNFTNNFLIRWIIKSLSEHNFISI